MAAQSADRKCSLSSAPGTAHTQERRAPSRTKAWLTSADTHDITLSFSLDLCACVRVCVDSQRVCVSSLADRQVRATEARKVCVSRRARLKGLCCTLRRVRTRALLNRKRPRSHASSKTLSVTQWVAVSSKSKESKKLLKKNPRLCLQMIRFENLIFKWLSTSATCCSVYSMGVTLKHTVGQNVKRLGANIDIYWTFFHEI